MKKNDFIAFTALSMNLFILCKKDECQCLQFFYFLSLLSLQGCSKEVCYQLLGIRNIHNIVSQTVLIPRSSIILFTNTMLFNFHWPSKCQ